MSDKQIIRLTFDISNIDHKCKRCGKVHNHVTDDFTVQFMGGKAVGIHWDCECDSTMFKYLKNLNKLAQAQNV